MNERALIAYHKAGHAVAAVKRSESSIQAVRISAADDFLGGAGTTGQSRDSGFVAWAGPWAQARAAWSSRPAREANREFRFDRERELDQYGAETHSVDGHTDHQVVEQHFAALPWPSMRTGSETSWGMELATMWPAIERVAAWLQADEPVTNHRILELISNDLD